MNILNKKRSEQKPSVVLVFAPSSPDALLWQHIKRKFDISSDTIVLGALCESGENELAGYQLSPEAGMVLRRMFDIQNGMVVAAVIDGEHEVTIASTQGMFQ
ncbi:MAG: hypothetical protein AAGF95_05170 [Chloroflexota bacterium]